ncbi:MAG: hypothetical protein JWN44_4627 [Myxococcales bacterium]|nr:hypothetical protein [Myxococcales bacterium]
MAATFTLSGCPAAHDDYPGASCKVDKDCFKGEKCMNSICVAQTDMSAAVMDLSTVGMADMTDVQDAAPTGDDL